MRSSSEPDPVIFVSDRHGSDPPNPLNVRPDPSSCAPIIIKKEHRPGCLCQVLAGPAADVTNDDDATEIPAGSETDDVSMATTAGATLFTANDVTHFTDNNNNSINEYKIIISNSAYSEFPLSCTK